MVVTTTQIGGRLGLVAGYPRYIRDWGSRNGLEYVPDVAAGYGIGVAQSAYLDLSAADNEQEKANLVAAAVRGNVLWAIVGTEALVNGKVTEGQLISHLDDVRKRLDQAGLSHIPVATAEPYGSWANAQPGGLFHRNNSGELEHANVFKYIDVLFAHLYPFHEGTEVGVAAGKLSTMYAEVIAAVNEVVPGLPVVIGETGWPSCGLPNRGAIPSLANEEQYFRQATAWADANAVPMFWFAGFDENWKPEGYVGVEKHFGLHYANGEPKFAIPEPTSLCLLGAGLLAMAGRRLAQTPRDMLRDYRTRRCVPKTPSGACGVSDGCQRVLSAITR